MLKDLPSPAGTFVWMVKGEVARNGLRIHIETKYQPQPSKSTSLLNLTNTSWRDTGENFFILE